MTDNQLTKLDKQVAVMESKLDDLSNDVSELKEDMKSHITSASNNYKELASKLDKLLWAIAIGAATLIIKLVFIK